jgi:NADH dehydrogenase [ubiquinone] 1 alpha subcomplex assembly factor 7
MTHTLTELIKQTIKAEGPISMAQYMELCLTHPELGYYMTRDPFGAAGDFTTAPEMTQVFGEIIGLWCVEVWKNLGCPARFSLCELGPGRGTLLADALRAAQMVPDFVNGAEIHLLEVSPKLRERQAATLAAWKPKWIDELEKLPDQPVIFIANEFFDALPIRQFVHMVDGWKERRIALTGSGSFVFVAAPATDAPNYESDEGAVQEICPSAMDWASAIARPIVKNRGAALIIDYGDEEVIGETLQAVASHRKAHLLTTAGHADITAHVSFAPLMKAARKIGCKMHGWVTQGEFLLGLGAKERTEALLAKATPEQQRSLQGALHRLTDPASMGSLFKVLAFTDKASKEPPGFGY